MSRSYRIHEFAELAGVTIRALHHYDRIGLLRPRRTESGYRVYTGRDLERLEQIVALKFLGLTLRQVKVVLERSPLELPGALRLQRRAIEKKQELLARAVHAICAAEESLKLGQPADLKRIIEIINMPENIELMKQYYSEESWQRHRRYYENGPSAEWQELYREANAMLDEDPGSDKAQKWADRWLELVIRAGSGDPELQTDSPMAWLDRQNWPPAMKRRIVRFNLEEVMKFLARVVRSARKRYFTGEAWTRYVELRKRFAEDAEAYSRFWQAHVDLFHDIEAAPSKNLPRERLNQRWKTLLEDESGGDAAVRDGLMRMWADRTNWSATLRWQIEGLTRMTGERFDKAAEFLARS